MNKYEEALLYLSVHKCNTCVLESQVKAINEQQKHQLALKELVEKATPKKPKYTYFNNELVNYHCPNCGEAQGLNVNKWWNRCCPHCGQALDWSDKE